MVSWKLQIYFVIMVYNLVWIAEPLPTTENCGKYMRDPKVVGGENAVPGEFPWLVSLKSIKFGHFCAAFVIGKRTLLSAAHCFLERSNPQIKFNNGQVDLTSLHAVLGEFDQNEKEQPIDSVSVNLENIMVHPDYDIRSKENDIAILRLAEDISVHPNVVPICMPEKGQSNKFVGKKATVSGWGRHYFDQPTNDWAATANILRKADVKVWNSKTCSDTYNEQGYNFPSKSFLCANEKKTDSCQGDSGGSLQTLDNGKWVAIGIVSVGKACGESGLPGVYTDVVSFLDWIEKYTEN